MSQILKSGAGIIPPGTFIETLTGNTGGPVGPDGSDNINIIGSGGVDVAGNPGTNTLTITAAGSVATTYYADTGSATPAANILNVLAGTATLHCGSTVSFSGAVNTLELNVTDSSSNTIIGQLAGNATLTGELNVGLGSSSFTSLTTGSENCFIGYLAGNELTSGDRNASIGTSSLFNIQTGTYNAALGYAAGSALTTSDSSNVMINHPGVPGDTHTLRIGASTSGVGNQSLSSAFICGISGVNVGSTAQVVTMGTAGTVNQLGTAVITAGTGISITPAANTITIAATGTTNLTYTNVNHAASPYTVLSTDEYISVDSSGGVVSLLFPNAATTGRVYIVKDRTGSSAANNITVTTVGGAVNIDGATTFVMNTNYEAVNVIGNATSYEVF